MFDAVLTYHSNPNTCGVCKFNVRLARELGVPCVPIGRGYEFTHPLISIKASEIGTDWTAIIPLHGDILLHDRPPNVPSGRRVIYADEVGCPSTIEGRADRGGYRVLTFGMGHKRLRHHFEALKTRLDAEHDNYTVEMSCAIHEGHPWSEGMEASIREMRSIFGDKLRVLGFLGDDALAKELQECDAVALFFDPAVRANNTTYWAAVDAGKTVFTNRDQDSPTEAPTWAGLVAAVSSRVEDSATVST